MKSFLQLLIEASKAKTNELDAIEDMADALSKVFKDYSMSVRKSAWKKLISSKGKEEVNRLIENPDRTTKVFRSL